MFDFMGKERLPSFILKNYDVYEWKHACAILSGDFPSEWSDITAMLTEFRLRREWIVTPGGSKSSVAGWLDQYLFTRGWKEKNFDTKVTVDK